MNSKLVVLRRQLTRRLRRFAVEHAWAPAEGASQHPLGQRLLVSITSYRPRFDSLHLTLRCLLNQTIRPDALILWVASEEAGDLPQKVRMLERYGLVIEGTDDIRSYKKLVPILRQEPGSIIVTADDDAFYPSNWLEGLVTAAADDPGCVYCYRARTIVIRGETVLPYREWPLAGRSARGDLIMPTGVGGVLYPPCALDIRATDAELFMRLCPTADDLWFYWMARQMRTNVAVVSQPDLHVSWPDVRGGSLALTNVAGGANDRQFRALNGAFPLFPRIPQE